MSWDSVAARIGSHFAPSLINGDETGLTDDEPAQLNQFMARIEKGRAGGHWEACDTEAFARCEVTGLMSECVNVTYHFPMQASLT